MPLPNGQIGITSNPMLKSPFVQHWQGEGINPPPPSSELMITEVGGLQMRTEISNDLMITE